MLPGDGIMISLHVTTWNLLHRVHAENWGEAIPARYPNETVRGRAIADRVIELAQESDFLGLQEVSGDQLEQLRLALPRTNIFSFRYPRLPRPRGWQCTLKDPSEHLVLVNARARPARLVEADTFADDPGKGFLAVEVGNLLVVATHLSTGKRNLGQLACLRARVESKTAVLLGDFNAGFKEIQAGLGELLAAAPHAIDALPTRPRTVKGRKSEVIDHVLVAGGDCGPARVQDARGVSDHNIVSATVVFHSLEAGFQGRQKIERS